MFVRGIGKVNIWQESRTIKIFKKSPPSPQPTCPPVDQPSNRTITQANKQATCGTCLNSRAEAAWKQSSSPPVRKVGTRERMAPARDRQHTGKQLDIKQSRTHGK